MMFMQNSKVGTAKQRSDPHAQRQHPGYSAHVDPISGRTFYQNTQTGESQWDVPPPPSPRDGTSPSMSRSGSLEDLKRAMEEGPPPAAGDDSPWSISIYIPLNTPH